MPILKIEKENGDVISVENIFQESKTLVINNIYRLKKRDYVIYECDESGEIIKQQFRFREKFFTTPIYKESIQRRKTNLERYGVENPYQSKEVKEKIRKANIEKHGVENPMQNKKISSKSQSTQRRKNGGVLGWNNQKQKEVIKEKYGDEAIYKTQHFKEKSKGTKKIKYGDENFNNPDKRKKTNLEKYGDEAIYKTQHFKEKSKGTKKIKYGDENFNNPDKRKKTNLEKYGSENMYGSEYFKEKSKMTMLEKYGAEYPSQVKEIYDKVQSTMLKRYGSKTFLTSDTFIEMGIHNVSRKYQSEIESFLLENNIEFESNNRMLIKPQELDIYIPSHSLAIEFNGLYWHSDIYKDKKYHLNKTDACENVGIRLIHIFEDEWLNKKDIVKARLRNMLGLNSRRIGARKTTIKEIDSKTKNEFLKTNHIQGSDKSSIKLGAFYEDELVGVMTFSKPRIFMNQKNKNKDGIWELSRFATIPDTYTPGLAGKLFSYFKKNYSWEEVYSYADRRWSQGNLYYKLGFDFDSLTPINYFYSNNPKVRHHRYKFRKSELKIFSHYSDDKTEHQIMDEAGYLRIYDCGNMKFTLHL